MLPRSNNPSQHIPQHPTWQGTTMTTRCPPPAPVHPFAVSETEHTSKPHPPPCAPPAQRPPNDGEGNQSQRSLSHTHSLTHPPTHTHTHTMSTTERNICFHGRTHYKRNPSQERTKLLTPKPVVCSILSRAPCRHFQTGASMGQQGKTCGKSQTCQRHTNGASGDLTSPHSTPLTLEPPWVH